MLTLITYVLPAKVRVVKNKNSFSLSRKKTIDRFRIPVKKRTNSRYGVIIYSDLYEIVHQSLHLILLCVLDELEPEGSIM